MERKVYTELLNWKNNSSKKPLMVHGARQVGKTYIIEEFCKNEYSNYIKLDLAKETDYRDLFASHNNFEEIYEEFKIRLSKNINIEDSNSIIFFDEIQECKELIEYLKYFCEDHNNVNIICAGSLLGTMMSRTPHFAPVGKVWDIYMHPMNFEEFLLALNKEDYIKKIKDCYTNNKKIGDFLHKELIKLYNIYSYIGGMPESIKNFIENNCEFSEYNSTIVTNIIDRYIVDMNRYVNNSYETLRINEIFDNIGKQLGNISHKFQPSKINKNRRLEDYFSAIEWLYTSKLLYKCYSINRPEVPIKVYSNNDVFKLYMNDCGILSRKIGLEKSNILVNEKGIYNGIIAENYVATQLIINGISLYYWMSGNQAEVDFVVNLKDGIIPIEVKSGNNKQAKSLKIYMEKFNPIYGIRISSSDFSYDSNTKIKDIPLYAAFCIN